MTDKTENTRELALHMLKELESPSKPLTDWEENFLDDQRVGLERYAKLTDKQFAIVERIYAEKTA